MRQVVKVSLEDVFSCGQMSIFAVYRDDKWRYPYRLYDMCSKKKKVWVEEFETLAEATKEAVAAAMRGHYE